eukprot:6457785-Amphidinium_carterae.1
MQHAQVFDLRERNRTVSFSEPLVEKVVEFVVWTQMKRTTEYKTRSRACRDLRPSVGDSESEALGSSCASVSVEGNSESFALGSEDVQVCRPCGLVSDVPAVEYCEDFATVAAQVIHQETIDEEDDFLILEQQKASHTSVSPNQVVASTGPQRQKWTESIDKELGRLKDTGTLERLDEDSLSCLRREATSKKVPLVIIPAQLVFVVKADGSYKSRL